MRLASSSSRRYNNEVWRSMNKQFCRKRVHYNLRHGLHRQVVTHLLTTYLEGQVPTYTYLPRYPLTPTYLGTPTYFEPTMEGSHRSPTQLGNASYEGQKYAHLGTVYLRKFTIMLNEHHFPAFYCLFLTLNASLVGFEPSLRCNVQNFSLPNFELML